MKETLEPYKASHARMDALEFRLTTVALLAENVPRSLIIEKRDLLLRDFFEVEKREYDSPYTKKEEKRIVSFMLKRMGEVKPMEYKPGISAEELAGSSSRVMQRIGSNKVEDAKEVATLSLSVRNSPLRSHARLFPLTSARVFIDAWGEEDVRRQRLTRACSFERTTSPHHCRLQPFAPLP